MTRLLGFLTIAAAAVALWPGVDARAVQAQVLAPQVQNGQVEHRASAGIARDLAAVGGGAAVWVGWTVPMADGPRDLCNWYSNPSMTVRGFFAEATTMDDATRPITPPSGPVPLEAGNGLVVLARVENGALDRVRTLSDDCPIDAGGRTIHWLDGVTPAESLAWLDSLTAVPSTTVADRMAADRRRSLANAAVGAIALHAAPEADRILERLAGDQDLRRQAASRLATARGAAGFAMLQRLLAAAPDVDTRRVLAGALGQTRQPGTPDALLRIAREDADARTRGEAAANYIRLAGTAGIDAVVAIIERDAEVSVKRRAIAGLAALPDQAGLPALITLARSSADLTVKKEAVTAVSKADDPRARALLEEIIKR